MSEPADNLSWLEDELTLDHVYYCYKCQSSNASELVKTTLHFKGTREIGPIFLEKFLHTCPDCRQKISPIYTFDTYEAFSQAVANL